MQRCRGMVILEPEHPNAIGGSAMFRCPFRGAVVLALGLVGSEYLDAASASGLFLSPATFQKKKHDEDRKSVV